MKRCSKCGVEKELEEFSERVKNPDGKQIWCKQCMREYRTHNKNHLQEKARRYRETHKDIILAKSKEYYEIHKEEIIKKVRVYRRENAEIISERRKIHHSLHKEENARRCREYRDKNKERVSLKNKTYREENMESIRTQKREHRLQNREIFIKKDRDYYLTHRDDVCARARKYSKTPNGRMVAIKCSHKRRYAIENAECTLTQGQWEKIIQLQNNRCVLCGKLFTKKNPATRDHIIPVIPYNGPFTMENTQALHRSCNSRKRNKLDKSNIVVWISALAQEV